jgi:single-strand DNA-binding protein
MYNEAHISVNGYVATQPYLTQTRTGIPKLNMRVAWTPRRLDRVTGEWADAGTSFCAVVCYRKMAENGATCLRKGDPVVIRGRVTVRDFEDKSGVKRSLMEIDASSLGHDLSRGVAQFQRTRPQTGMTALEYQTDQGDAPGGAPGQDDDFGPGELDGTTELDGAIELGGAGEPDDEMFDGDAVGALAGQAAGVPAGVTAPF